ncbi:MAG: hypothetical protein ACRCXL_10080 [Dermatophilaceae bacterium]
MNPSEADPLAAVLSAALADTTSRLGKCRVDWAGDEPDESWCVSHQAAFDAGNDELAYCAVVVTAWFTAARQALS